MGAIFIGFQFVGFLFLFEKKVEKLSNTLSINNDTNETNQSHKIQEINSIGVRQDLRTLIIIITAM